MLLIARLRTTHRDVQTRYALRIEQLKTGKAPRFQLTIALHGERHLEFMPVHQTAFAQKLVLAVCHADESSAQFELTGLVEWIEARTKNEARSITDGFKFT